MEQKPVVQAGDKDLEYINGEIAFEKVDFAYPSSNNMILDSMDVRINGGTTVAIVGSSGVGKSTLMSLIKRQYNIDGGVISIDGQDITTLKDES